MKDIEKFNLFTIHSDETIERALCKLEENNCQTLIVVDADSRVIGTLTDGDIRKALIAKRSTLAPIYDVMNTHYQFVTLEKIAEAKAIFDKFFYINLIPVINQVGILQDVLLRSV